MTSGSSAGKESICNAGDLSLIPGLGRSFGGGCGNPLQYWVSLVVQLVKNLPAMQETLFKSWVGKIPWKRDRLHTPVVLGFPGGPDSKESTCNVGDLDSIPGLGRSPEEGHGNPLQYSCLENLHGQRSQMGNSSWGCKSRTGLSTHSNRTLTVLCLVTQFCPTLCDPMGIIHGIL